MKHPFTRVSGSRDAVLERVTMAALAAVLSLLVGCLDDGPCGNSMLDSGEQCDDGNRVDGDGCDSNCQFEALQTCGNGLVEGFEECDDGNDVVNDGCEPNCKWSCRANFDCNDGNACNGQEVCHLESHRCVVATEPLEDGTSCDLGKVCLAGTCRPSCVESSDCEDLGVCAGEPTCVSGACAYAPLPNGTVCQFDLDEVGLCLDGACIPPECGDGFCFAPEDDENCYTDCGSCGDGVCTTGKENAQTCASDCPAACGDGLCTHTETGDACYVDCGRCGDGYCEGPESFESCPSDCQAPPRFCVARYVLDPLLHIESSPQNVVDDDYALPAGAITLRYQADDLGAPKEGASVELLYFWVRQEFSYGRGALLTPRADSFVNLFSPRCIEDDEGEPDELPPEICEDDGNEAPLARGTWHSGVVQWESCVSSDWNSTHPAEYTPDDVANGPGCLGELTARGLVECTPASLVGCDSFELEAGTNVVDESWNQPLEAMELSDNGESLYLPKTNIPNRWYALYYLELTGTATEKICDLP